MTWIMFEDVSYVLASSHMVVMQDSFYVNSEVMTPRMRLVQWSIMTSTSGQYTLRFQVTLIPPLLCWLL
jgi:hypothetical protein